MAAGVPLTAALVQATALLAAQHLPSWKIVDYASASKPDAPSGTARELADARRDQGPGPGDRGRRDGGPRRGAWRDGGRNAGPLGPPSRLHPVHGGRVRASRSAPDDSPRCRVERRTVRRRHAARGPCGHRAQRTHPRAGHAPAELGRSGCGRTERTHGHREDQDRAFTPSREIGEDLSDHRLGTVVAGRRLGDQLGVAERTGPIPDQ